MTYAQLRLDSGRYLAGLRQGVNLTQAGLAKAVGYDYYTFISQIENGRVQLPEDKWLTFAKVLKVDPKEFAAKMLSFLHPLPYALLFKNERKHNEWLEKLEPGT